MFVTLQKVSFTLGIRLIAYIEWADYKGVHGC